LPAAVTGEGFEEALRLTLTEFGTTFCKSGFNAINKASALTF
jgi:hypothetical protein